MLEAGRLREQVDNHGRACTQVLFLSKVKLGFFHLPLVGTAWLVPSTAGDPACWNRFLQANKGAENTKEKSKQCFTVSVMQRLTAQMPCKVFFQGFCQVALMVTLCLSRQPNKMPADLFRV